MIKRPNVEYDDAKHEYRLNGEKLSGVSTVAKIGEDGIWGIASAWGFRIGYEGALTVLKGYADGPTDAEEYLAQYTPEVLREELKRHRLTPWHRKDKAADRGNSVHDALEQLAQKGVVPALDQFKEDERGFVQGLCRWYLDYRPSFEATEVQVVSEKHKFAGRYDIRAMIVPKDENNPDLPPGANLCLIDLKTGKGVYPTSHFAQLAGYELAGTEMGYPATDAQFILNVKEDGTYKFARSNAELAHFLAYLAAHRAILDIKTKNKKGKK